jgi:hypothetical protein
VTEHNEGEGERLWSRLARGRRRKREREVKRPYVLAVRVALLHFPGDGSQPGRSRSPRGRSTFDLEAHPWQQEREQRVGEPRFG